MRKTHAPILESKWHPDTYTHSHTLTLRQSTRLCGVAWRHITTCDTLNDLDALVVRQRNRLRCTTQPQIRVSRNSERVRAPSMIKQSSFSSGIMPTAKHHHADGRRGLMEHGACVPRDYVDVVIVIGGIGVHFTVADMTGGRTAWKHRQTQASTTSSSQRYICGIKSVAQLGPPQIGPKRCRDVLRAALPHLPMVFRFLLVGAQNTLCVVMCPYLPWPWCCVEDMSRRAVA